VNVSGLDIVDGSSKLLLALLWQVWGLRAPFRPLSQLRARVQFKPWTGGGVCGPPPLLRPTPQTAPRARFPLARVCR
jgi:hypothetical protein